MKFFRRFTRFLFAAFPALALATTPTLGAEKLPSRGADTPAALRRPAFNVETLRMGSASELDPVSTLAPSGSHAVDMDCSVVNWDTSNRKPILTLACFTQKKPTPYRMLIQLSWLRSDSRSGSYRRILAPPKTAARFHSDAHGAFVRLRLQDPCRGKLREDWVRFSELVCLEMVREPLKAREEMCPRSD